ncbi:MAG: ABC transporter permease [Candidatus Stygibacter frigidus]|nr:ABC transporter permease [Candidatus Stygibacter frigidus]
MLKNYSGRTGKYFNGEDAVGKSLKVNNGYDVTVSDIISDLPRQSHLRLDFLVHLLHWRIRAGIDIWNPFLLIFYVINRSELCSRIM